MKETFTKNRIPILSWRYLMIFTLICLFGIQGNVFAQQKLVKGTVLDAAGMPIPGANIVIKGTTKGAVSDLDGIFTIQLEPTENILVISYIGYEKTEVNVSNQSEITVRLTESFQLSEVVITAAGIERNTNTLGYSVSSLDNEKISQRNEPDPVRALTGKIAGVNIQGAGGVAGGATNITIRGNSSLGNNNQPLFVVDGVPFDNSSFESAGTNQTQSSQSTSSRAFDIDPNNIESLTVLKGAAASALYGSRAANGAIIITTKTGSRKGRKGMEITYNSSYSNERLSGIPDFQDKYGQGTNGDYRAGVFGSYGSPYSSRATIPHPLALTTNPASQFPQFYEANGITPVEVPYRSYMKENVENFFRRGNLFENSIMVSGGGEKTSLIAGFTRTSNDGVVPGNSITRTSFNVGGNAKLDNGFFVRGTLNYVKTNQTSPPIGGSGSIMGNLLFMPTSFDLTGYPFENPVTGANVYYRALDNPYWSVKNSPATSEVDRTFGSFVLGKEITPWLTVQNTFGFNSFTDNRLSVLGKGSSVYANGTINTDNIYREELDNVLLATINTKINDDLKVRVILGNNINQRLTRRAAFSGDGIIVAGLNDIRNTTTITLGNIPNNQTLIKQRFYAFFGDVTFDYKNYASLNFVGRNDVSSTLPAENRSYLYGGVNGSLVFTEALKMNSSVLNFGTIRAGYTKVGNEASPYQTVNVFNANASFGGIDSPFSNATNSGISTQTISNSFANSALKPEFITEFEVGTELRFFQNLFTLDLTYYAKESTSQIFVVNAAPSSGFLTRIINLGETSNKGIEIGLTANPFVSDRGFNWSINANFTRNRNKVENLGGFAQLTYGGNVHIEGLPYGMIFGTRFARDDEGSILVNPQTAKPILATTSGPIGDPNPDFFAGLNNTFSYRGITLDVLFDMKSGGDILSTTIGETYARGVLRDTEDRDSFRIGSGYLGNINTRTPLLDEDGNKIPNNTALNYNDYFFGSGFGPSGPSAGYVQEAAIFDATVVRLREISLGYMFPRELLSKTPFGSAFISMSGRNLWYKAPNTPAAMRYDPEVSTAGANNLGYDQLGVPPTKRYGVNLRFTF
ncbi:SusC/RagA family TonB-linked outer membrane protein [Cognataquiflexum rubidum]|uniref:SusC/RagA family TonB-linked outer membrane protein n=1 Tax=Cognataquiflexum rubidum TaxID=2922273 RepID=UPI001F13ACE9|nr:SusC/RagA family TonB-linked outer membrane protein [Cognataquiflexum rubidum]MCH6234471.1 SusC/RagA family TonB-linked outer membrane protein [Cognataquiflexum rubidum]